MNTTRIFSPFLRMSLASGVILFLTPGFIAWLTLAETNIDLSGLTFRQDSGITTVDFHSPGANAEGLAIYHQSECNVALTRANEAGLAIYHESEWGTNSSARPNAAGFNIYRQNERFNAAPDLIERGMAIYHQSKHNAFPANPDTTKEQGMEMYYASERGR